jgi:hypothetical protein
VRGIGVVHAGGQHTHMGRETASACRAMCKPRVCEKSQQARTCLARAQSRVCLGDERTAICELSPAIVVCDTNYEKYSQALVLAIFYVSSQT